MDVGSLSKNISNFFDKSGVPDNGDGKGHSFTAALMVVALEARNLLCLGTNGSAVHLSSSPLPAIQPYPYLSMRLRKKQYQTKVTPASSNPTWNEPLPLGQIDIGPNSTPVTLEMCVLDATPLTGPEDCLGSADFDVLKLFSQDGELEDLRRDEARKGAVLLRDVWVSLDGASSGEVHLRFALAAGQRTEFSDEDWSFESLAVAETLRHDKHRKKPRSHPPAVSLQGVWGLIEGRYLQRLEERSFWRW